MCGEVHILSFHHVLLSGHTVPSVPETPSRTLINPVLGGGGQVTEHVVGGGGQVTAGDSTRAQSTAPSCTVTSRSETVSGLSGSLSLDYKPQHSPDCKVTITPDSGVTMMDKVAVISEVRLDNNGHVKTVMVAESDPLTEQTAR